MSKVLFSIGFVQILIILTNMGRAKILSILLGPAGFGVVATIDQVVLSVVQLAGFAVPFIALKFLSHAHSESHDKFQQAYSSFLTGILGLSVTITAMLLVALYFKPDLFGLDILPYVEYLHLALFSVPTLMLAIFFVNTLAAAQQSSRSAFLNFYVTLALAVAAVGGVMLGGMFGLYVAAVGTGVLTTIATVLYVGKSLDLKALNPSSGLIKEIKRKPEIASTALVLHVALSAYSVSMLTVRFFVFTGSGEEQAGFLQALLSIALALGAISGPMNALFLMPLLNRALPLQEKLAAAHSFLKNITLVLSVIALPVVLFPKLAIFVLFSSEFLEIAPVVYLFVLWQCLYQMVNVYQQLLIGLDDTLFFSVSSSLGYVVAIAICSPLIAVFALKGAAIALVVGILVSSLITSYRMKSKFRSAIPLALWLRMSLCLGSIAIIGIVFNQIEEWSVGGLVARLGFSFVYIAALWFLLSSEQKQFVLNLRRRLPF